MPTISDLAARFPERTPAPAPAPQESLAQRGLRRTGQELLATPAAAGTLYGLIGSAYDYYTSDDPDLTWGETLLSEEGMELMKQQAEGDPVAELRLRSDPSAALRTGLQSADQWYKWGGDVMGVTDNPDGTVPLDEEALGIAGSVMVPLPTKLISLPTKLIAGVTNKAARGALKAGVKAAELTLPGTPTAGYMTGVPANLVVQEGLNDVVRTLTEQPTLYGAVLGTNPEEAAVITAAAGEGTPEGDADPEGAAMGKGALAAAAGGAAIALGGPAAVRALTRNTLTNTVTSPHHASLGDSPVREGAGIRDNLADLSHWALNKEGVLTSTVEKVRGKAAAETFEDKMRASSGNATHVAYERYVETGILESDNSIRTVAPRAVFNEYHGAKKPQQELFNQTYEALDERVRRDLGEKPNLSLSDTDLHARITAGLNNQWVGKMVRDTDDIMRGFSELRYQAGVTDMPTFAKERMLRFDPRKGYGGYMPNIPKTAEPEHWLTKARKKVLGGRETTIQSANRMLARGGVDEKMPPMDALNSYMRKTISETANMRLRRDFLELVADKPVRDFKAGRRVATDRRGDASDDMKVTVYKDGKVKEYWVGDARIKRALEFSPHYVRPVANVMRKAFQAGTTGNFNPLFAPISLAYDALFGMLSANTKHMVTGLIDQTFAKYGMPPALRSLVAGMTRPIDTMLLIGEGLKEGGLGRLTEETAKHLAMRAAQTGLAIDKQAALAASHVFLSTKYGTMHMSGYSANSLTEDLARMDAGLATSAWNKALDAMTGQLRSKPGRTYVHVLDNIRDSYRMGIFSRNMAHQQWINKQAGRATRVTPEQYRRITRHTRDVAVDPTKRGASDFINGLTSATPYGSIMMHSAAHLAKVMATNPGAWAVAGTTTGAILWARSAMSPEARQWIDERMPDYKRYSSLTFEMPHSGPFDPAKHLFSIPLGAEMGLITHGPVALIEGMIRERESYEPGFMAKMGQALGDLLSLPVPPVVNVAATALGYGPADVGALLRGDSPFREPQDPGGVNEFRGVGQADGLMSDWLYNTMAAAFGSFGRTVADSAEIMDQELQSNDPHMREAFGAALGNVYFDRVAKTPVGTLFSGAVVEKPRGTPQADLAYNVNEQLERITAFARQLIPSYTEGPRDADIPYSEALTRLPEQLTDPMLQTQAVQVRAYFLSHPHETAMQNIGQLRRSYFQTRNMTKDSTNIRNTMLNAINDEMHQNYSVVLDGYGRFEDGMRATYGQDWSLETFVSAAEDNIQSGQ